MELTETTIQAPDSTDLFVRHYRTVNGLASHEPSRTVVIVHGMSEHGARYEHVAKRFVSEGWNVVVGDMRGHGRSAGVPTHVNNFDDYLDDLDQLWRHFQLRPERTALLGHSFGGLVSARFAQTRQNVMRVVVLMSPLMSLKVEVSPVTYALGKMASLLVPKTRFQNRIDPADTTRNQELLDRRADDPLMHRSVTAGWFFEMQRALKAVWREQDRIQVPVLAFQAGLDRIVDPTAVEPWLKNIGNEDTTFELFAEHFHELLNEPDWPETAGRILSWLDERIPAKECVGS